MGEESSSKRSPIRANVEAYSHLRWTKKRGAAHGSHGRYRIETLSKGDVGYIPQGYGHSIENVGKEPCRVLIGFNSGHYEAIDLSMWIAGNPVDVLATNFGKPASLFEKFPRERVFIAPTETPGHGDREIK
jgi:oxalate decarboxylase